MVAIDPVGTRMELMPRADMSIRDASRAYG
jgi:hypothetical protein